MTMTEIGATNGAAPHVAAAGAQLEMKLIGEIDGSFIIERYQRGYRWGKLEVERLLNDIYDSKGKPYSLQPVVVKKRDLNNEWELVDGQQRLTTLYLIYLYMERARLKLVPPSYNIHYATRKGCEAFILSMDPTTANNNIDFFHLYKAYTYIEEWFENKGARARPKMIYIADTIYRYFFESVRVIWYEAHNVDSATLFTRLNVGRIPLTDAELIKALLFTLSRARDGHPDRVQEMAIQWDGIERDLRNPDVWAFITDTDADDSPTRITLLLDTLAGGPIGRERPRFHTFDTLRQMIANTSAESVWNEILDLHALVIGWFENRDLYHKIGYLVAVGRRFSDLVGIAKDRAKSYFEATLDGLIRETLELNPSGVTALSYETDADKDKCGRLLLLMNVETVRRVEHSSERYSFRLHKEGAWSLEHIHAQHAENLTKTQQWEEWLRLHREALKDITSDDQERRDEIMKRIDAIGPQVDRNSFQDLSRDVVAFFTREDSSNASSVYSIHSIANLALLCSGDNSALGNAVFEVKRRRIIERDKKGDYIPLCTRNVFLKYYTNSDAQQIHFWGPQDRKSYLDAMISPEHGVIFPYLRQEEKSS